ncbi:MAG: PTS sugar transporter subunit IIC [bacterium]
MTYCFVAGIVYLDTDAVGQFAISQPLVACTIAGWIFGNITIGLTVGLLMQMPYLVEFPTGGAKVSVGNLGAYIAAGVAAVLSASWSGETELVLFLSILLGCIWSWALIPFQEKLRHFNCLLIYKADSAAQKGSVAKITLFNYLSVLGAFTFGVVFCALLFVISLNLCDSLLEMSSLTATWNVTLFKPILLGAGMGALIWHFLQRKALKFTAIGAIIGTVIWLF